MAATSIDVLYNMIREKKHSLNDDEMKIISELQSKYQEDEDDLQKYLDNMLDIAFAFDTSTALKSFIIDVIKKTREDFPEFKDLTNNLLINERYLPHSSNAINFSSVSM